MEQFDHIDHILSRLLSGEITKEEQLILDRWISVNKRNEQILKGIMEFWSDHSIPTMHVNYRESYTVFMGKRRKKRIRRRRLFYSIAGAALVVFISILPLIYHSNGKISTPGKELLSADTLDPDRSYLLFSNGSVQCLDTDHITENFYFPTMPNLAQTPLWAELVVGRRQMKSLVLPDKSIVTVNAGSRLGFPSVFSRNERRITLNGEAYFEVVPDPVKPFIIETKDCDVVVKGTTLNVRSYKDEFSEVTLFSGKVSVRSEEHAISIEMEPGEQFEIYGTHIFTTRIDPTTLPAWADGIFSFDNLEIWRAARELSHWYGVEISCADTSDRNTKLSGIFSRNIPLDHLIIAIENNLPLSFLKTDEGYLIQ